MTIDEALEYLNDFSLYSHYQEAINTINKASAYIEQMQADYNARLKADMVAMLDELDLELYEQYDDTDLIKVKYVRQAIQQKINNLKED